MATNHVSKEVVWLQRLFLGIGFLQKYIRFMLISKMKLLKKNPTYHAKTKHVDVKYLLLRYMVEDKKVLLEKVDTLKNVTDSLKKSVSTENLLLYRIYWY